MPNEHRAIRSRLDFSKIPTSIQIPNLIEVQRRSYERFLQMDKLPSEREDNGLQSVFTSVFPSPTSATSRSWILWTSPSATGSASAVTSRDYITSAPLASTAAPWSLPIPFIPAKYCVRSAVPITKTLPTFVTNAVTPSVCS